ncbi:MAG TPA: hypothetical protein V6D35_04180 [Candidatus Sericytochromatia bacterium]
MSIVSLWLESGFEGNVVSGAQGRGATNAIASLPITGGSLTIN